MSRNLTGRAAVVLLVLGALVVSYAQSLRVWFDQHQQITALQKEIRRPRASGSASSSDEIARWDDDAFVRAQARQRLGWVMPGEVGYRVIGADGKPVGAAAELDAGRCRPARRPDLVRESCGGSVAGRRYQAGARSQADDEAVHAAALVITPPTGDAVSVDPDDVAAVSASSDARPAGSGRSRTAARAGCRTWWRPSRGCRTVRRSRRMYYVTCPRLASAIGTLEAKA